MKVTFPHMGNLDIVVKALLESLDLEVIVPPPCSKRTLSLGVQHSPETACLPLKINMGNFIEAHGLGADTIIMAGGVGPCRFGYYAEVQKEILSDMGLNYQVVVLEPPDNHIGEFLSRVKILTGNHSWWRVTKAIRFAWQKAKAVDEVEQLAQKLRPREKKAGTVEACYRRALKAIDLAQTPRQVTMALSMARDSYMSLPLDWEREVLKVAIVGEIYMLLEPFANLDLERYLGSLGVEVNRSLYISQWINEHLFKGLLRVKDHKEARKLAKPYVGHFVGGHGQETVGSAVEFALAGYDGIVHLGPLTCMPEIVAFSALPKVSDELGVPTLSLFLDEQSGEAGIHTRLEAFIDLLRRKKEQKIKEGIL